MTRRMDVMLVLAIVVAALAFAMVTQRFKSIPRQTVNVEMQVALPLFVQVFGAAGDRYLAANLMAIRALWSDVFRMKPDEFAILAKLQTDVSWLNPSHEDNYYIAAAVLPWNGEFDAGQMILARATAARRFDFMPAFFYAFNLLHFKGDAVGASTWLHEAAQYLPDPKERMQMERLAAIWMDKAQDLEQAARVVEMMASQASRKDFRRYLEVRAARLRMLHELRRSAVTYQQRTGQTLLKIEDLIDSGILRELPTDPLGFGFALDKRGQIILRNSHPAREK